MRGLTELRPLLCGAGADRPRPDDDPGREGPVYRLSQMGSAGSWPQGFPLVAAPKSRPRGIAPRLRPPYSAGMRLRPLLFGAPVGVLWLLFFTVSPLPAVIALLMVLAWLDHRHRRVMPERASGRR